MLEFGSRMILNLEEKKKQQQQHNFGQRRWNSLVNIEPYKNPGATSFKPSNNCWTVGLSWKAVTNPTMEQITTTGKSKHKKPLRREECTLIKVMMMVILMMMGTMIKR